MEIYKLFFLLLFTQPLLCQNWKIEKIEISDTILYNTLKDYIKTKKKENPKFLNKGYVDVSVEYRDRGGSKDKVKIEYYLIDQYYFPRKLGNLPRFYCYIDEKLIFIKDHHEEFVKYKSIKKALRKINRLVDPYLNKRIHLKARDENGKVFINDKYFRDETFTIHGGITLSIYNNGKYEVKSNY